MSDSWITVFGGTGFLGRRIVERLAGDGVKVRVVARNPDRASAIELSPDAKIERVRADLRDPESIAAAVAGARGVVNAVGLYVERGGETFDAVHVAGAACVAEQAAKAGVARLVHISGIGVDGASDSAYIRARANGEAAVHEAFPAATILRPSVVFAPDDNFINLLLRMARVLPVLPLFGDGGTMLQPVFAGDVALAAARALDDPAAAGKTYELGGPVPYSYLLPVPFPIWEIQARLAGILPNPPLTSDQVALMRHDNLASPDLPGLADLGVTPTSLEATLPEYPALRAMSRGDG
jgi:NADH dehydrogenase